MPGPGVPSPERIGRYAVQRHLGAGGMGSVHLARDPDLDRLVAIKLLHDEAAADPEARARFRREARALAALNHPGIVTIYEIGRDGAHEFIAMEFLPGRTLRAVLQEGKVAVPEILAMCAGVAQALAAAHGAGVLHRDVKPENVMVGADGAIKVVDFGLARRLQDGERAAGGAAASGRRATRPPGAPPAELAEIAVQLTGSIARRSPAAPGGARAGAFETEATDTIFGTPAYMAPERLRGQETTPAGDVYSLGVLLYEVVSGVRPFEGKTLLETLEKVTDPAHRPERLDRKGPVAAALADLVERMIAYEAARRPTAGEVARTLADLVREARAPGPAPSREIELLATTPVDSGPAASPSGRPAPAADPLATPVAPAAPVDPAPTGAGAARRPLPRPLAAVALAAAAGVATFGVIAARDGCAPAAPDPGTGLAATALTGTAAALPPRTVVIAVVPFSSAAGGPAALPADDAISDVFCTFLRRVPSLDVLCAPQLRDLVGDLDPLDPGWNLGAGDLGAVYVVRGALRREADALSGTVTLHDLTGPDDPILSATEERPEVALDALLAALATRVVERIVPGSRVIAVDTHRSKESLEAYSLGTRALHRGAWRSAVDQLERAVAEAPEFFEAWYYLALARAWDAADPPSAMLAAAARAAELASAERDRSLMEALGHYLRRDFRRAMDILRPMYDRFPRDRDVGYLLGEALYHDGRCREGITVMHAVLEVAPMFHLAAIHPFQYALAHRDEASAHLYQAILRRSPGALAAASEPDLLFAMERFEGPFGRRVELEAAALERTGRPAEALALLEAWDSVPRRHVELMARALARRDEPAARASWKAFWEHLRAAPDAPHMNAEVRLAGEVLVAAERREELALLLTFWDGRSDPVPSDARWSLRAYGAPLLGSLEATGDEDAPSAYRVAAEASAAELRGDRVAAIAGWRKILADRGESGELLALVSVARNLHALDRRAELKEVCAEIARPPIWRPGFAVAAAACRRWGASGK